MVDRVELAMFDQIQSVSEFKNRDTGWFQKAFNTSDKIINLVHMSDHIVSDHDVRKLAFAGQLFGGLQFKEIVNCWHADRVCSRYRSVGRINTEAGDPAQITINSTPSDQ